MIGIIDYEAGNLNSVRKAFDFLQKNSRVLKSLKDFDTVDRLVLPGVGSYGHAMERIKEKGFIDPIKKWIESGQPFLGICLGLQILFESSQESKGVKGMSVFKGTCRRFTEMKVPQIGWNNIQIQRTTSFLRGIRDGEFFYFNHSYYVVEGEKEAVVAKSNYGIDYISIAKKRNAYGVQFHPEKSGQAGLKLLKNWVERC